MLCSLIAHSSHSFATPVLSPTPSSREERGRKGGTASPRHTTTASVSLHLVPALFSPFCDLPSSSLFVNSHVYCTTCPRARPCRAVSPCNPLARYRFHPSRASISLSVFVFPLTQWIFSLLLSFSLSFSRARARARTFVCVLTNRYVQVGVIFFRVREVGFYNAPVEAPQLVAELRASYISIK